MQNLQVVDISGNIVMLKGSVPGSDTGIVFIYNEGILDASKLPKKIEAAAAAPVVAEEAKA